MKVLILAVATLLVACGDSNDANNVNNTNNSNNSNNANNTNNANNSNSLNNSNNLNNTNNSNNNAGFVTLLASTVSEDFASSRYFFVTIDLATGQPVGEPTLVDYGSGDVGVTTSDEFAFAVDRGAFPDNNGAVTMFDLFGNQVADFEVSDNPKDVAVVAGNVYVSQYNQGTVAVFTDEDGAFEESDLIDLTAFDDDGNSEPDSMWVDGDNVLVVMQRLTNFAGVNDSCVAVIDGLSGTIIDQDPVTDIDDATCLDIKNAWAGIVPASGGFAVGGIGDFGASDSGITILTDQGGGLYENDGVFVTEQALGGDLWSFTFDQQGRGYAVVDIGGVPNLKIAEQDAGVWSVSDEITLGSTLGSPVAAGGGFVVVGVRDRMSPKFVVYDAEGDVVSEVPTEYQPYDVSLLIP